MNIEDKRAELSESDLEKVAGGRRTDDPNQAKAYARLGIAESSAREFPDNIMGPVQRQETADKLYDITRNLHSWMYPSVESLGIYLQTVEALILQAEALPKDRSVDFYRKNLKDGAQALKDLIATP